jgi:hypothetical protein
MHLWVWAIWNGSLRCYYHVTSHLAIQLPDIDSASPNSPGNWLLHSIMHISIELDALELSPSPPPPFPAGSYLPSQISTQRVPICRVISYCIILCVYPSILGPWNHLLRHHHRFWPAAICLLRFRLSGPQPTRKLVVVTFYASIRRAESPGILSFAIAAIYGHHPFAFSDIDPATTNTPGNW